jgi:hypothetical protein
VFFDRQAFTTFDINNDGSIDFSEFLLAIAATSQGNIDDRLSVAFDMYDTSGHGQINQKELARMIAAMVTNRSNGNDHSMVVFSFVSVSTIWWEKPIEKEIVLRNDVPQKSSLNWMWVAIANWAKQNSLPGKSNESGRSNESRPKTIQMQE